MKKKTFTWFTAHCNSRRSLHGDLDNQLQIYVMLIYNDWSQNTWKMCK